MLHLDLEDLKQSNLKGEGGGGVGRWGGQGRKSNSYRKEPIGCISSPPTPTHPPLPGTESDVWPTMPSREQRGYQKSDPGGDHYYVGCLGQTRVSLPE